MESAGEDDYTRNAPGLTSEEIDEDAMGFLETET
jgi:hypothetical protein